MKKLLLLIIIGGLVAKANAVAVPVFDLPKNTPGLQNNGMGVNPPTIRIQVIDVQIPIGGQQQHIYFPADGSQPTTQDAAQYSCANVGAYDVDHPVTKWYIKAFGGDTGLELAQGNQAPVTDTAPKLGFDRLNSAITANTASTTLTAQMTEKHIITADGTENFKRAFWKTFKTIASDPVGRVLLYRLLIEIRREFKQEFNYTFLTNHPSAIVNAKSGAIEDNNAINIACNLTFLSERNNCRSITVTCANSNSFSLAESSIKFCNSDEIKTSVLKIDNNNIKTEQVKRDADIGLFHEMLHWFHYLRDYNRYYKDRRFDGSYCYLMACYLGSNKLQEIFKQYNELFAWATIEYKDEELRTILGTPNYDNDDEFRMFSDNVFVQNTTNLSECIRIRTGTTAEKYINASGKFLNGDDLSENAYRMSRFANGKDTVRMRFGHADDIKPVSIINRDTNAFEVDDCLLHKYRFTLPNLVAVHCYKNITSQTKNWSLKTGEAAN